MSAAQGRSVGSMEGGPPDSSSSQRPALVHARSSSLPPILSSRQPADQLQVQLRQPQPHFAPTVPETRWQMPLREAVELQMVPTPALMHWDDWQHWRKEEGAAPKGINREEYFQHASREGQLYKDTMAYYHGPAWKEQLESEQGIRHKEQPYRGFRVRRSSPAARVDAGSVEAAEIGERHARQVPLSEAQHNRLLLADSIPVPSSGEVLTPRPGQAPVEPPPPRLKRHPHQPLCPTAGPRRCWTQGLPRRSSRLFPRRTTMGSAREMYLSAKGNGLRNPWISLL